MRLSPTTMLQCSLLIALAACTSGSTERNDADLPDGEPAPEVDAETEHDAEAEPDAGPCVDAACEPEPEACWSWPANVLHISELYRDGYPATGWVEGERVWLVGHTLLELGPDGWVDHEISHLFDFQRGEGWSAVLAGSEEGTADWVDYQRDGEPWQRLDPPSDVLEPPLTAATHSETHLYVRSAGGVIARFDGERWERVAQNEPAPRTAMLALVGDVLYDSHDSITDVFENGSFTPVPIEYGRLLSGDGEHAFFSGPPSSARGRLVLKVGPAGSENMPVAPSAIHTIRAKGDQVAIEVGSPIPHVYRLVDGQWQLAAHQKLLALDADGTLLVGTESSASLVAPDGSTRVITTSHDAPTGPLVGESIDALWARGAHGGLLRLMDGHWELVPGTETLGLKAVWRSPSGVIFLATTSSEVYRLMGDRIEALAAPGVVDVHGLVGRGDEEVYLSSIDVSVRLHVQRWDGASWSELEALTTPTTGFTLPPPLWARSADAPCLSGASGFLTVRHNVGAPEDDPDYSSTGLASSGGPWHELLDHGEPGSDGLRAVQLGPADAPLGLFTSLQPPSASGAEQLLHYDIPNPEQPDQIMESGTLDHAFVGAIAGDDLDHMVGVVEVDGVMHFVFRDGGAWQTRGEGALRFGGRGTAWYGRDAIGVADDDGVTICKR